MPRPLVLLTLCVALAAASTASAQTPAAPPVPPVPPAPEVEVPPPPDLPGPVAPRRVIGQTPRPVPSAPRSPAQPAPPQPAQPPQPAPPAPPTPPPPPPPRGRLVNLQIELTITDQTGAGAPQKKVVTVIAADQAWGRIRAASNVRPSEQIGTVAVELNVDARPMLVSDDLIRLDLTIEYRPLGPTTGPDSQLRPTALNESLSVILTNGKPMTVSQAADPISDRRIAVEVKASVMK